MKKKDKLKKDIHYYIDLAKPFILFIVIIIISVAVLLDFRRAIL